MTINSTRDFPLAAGICKNSEKKTILRFENVSFFYRKKIQALTDINLTFFIGESIAICGPNGSVKTTLLKMAAGLLCPSAGKVWFYGKELNGATKKTVFRKIGFLFQDSEDQLFCPTVKEDIAYGPVNMKLGKDEIEQRVQYAMEIMQIKHLANRPIHHLSGGEKKRVALAGLLSMKPPMLIMDEPLNGLDVSTARELIKTFQQLNQDYGYTLIVVTHNIDRVPDFAKRIILLKDGTVLRDGDVTEVLTDIPSLQKSGLEAPIITRYFHWKNLQAGAKTNHLPLSIEEVCKNNGSSLLKGSA